MELTVLYPTTQNINNLPSFFDYVCWGSQLVHKMLDHTPDLEVIIDTNQDAGAVRILWPQLIASSILR